jgi:hypothetical protein
LYSTLDEDYYYDCWSDGEVMWDFSKYENFNYYTPDKDTSYNSLLYIPSSNLNDQLALVNDRTSAIIPLQPSIENMDYKLKINKNFTLIAASLVKVLRREIFRVDNVFMEVDNLINNQYSISVELTLLAMVSGIEFSYTKGKEAEIDALKNYNGSDKDRKEYLKVRKMVTLMLFLFTIIFTRNVKIAE